MTILFAAATALINPPGTSLALTMDQLWAGLELKRKQPQLFLAVIDTCEVLEDDGETVLREVKFKDGHGVGAAPIVGVKVKERISHIKPITPSAGAGIEIFQTIGANSRVLNVVSTGATPDDIYLTFTFAWDHPEIEAGSEEAIAKQKNYQLTAPAGLNGTLAEIRKLVSEGKL